MDDQGIASKAKDYVLHPPLDSISTSIFPVGLCLEVLKSVCMGDDVPLMLR